MGYELNLREVDTTRAVIFFDTTALVFYFQLALFS